MKRRALPGAAVVERPRPDAVLRQCFQRLCAEEGLLLRAEIIERSGEQRAAEIRAGVVVYAHD